ncbi:MAG: glycogen/starch/alpha-glucan phosphorylase [Myxococcales bacterium]|nr:glycogen/starch/alpha-glucan phosphorylase [Myxococcales bacterium]MDP3504537.1 glycogen/starch/alpha-glucan phosphorylase [Myxococcales bacterium]
MSTDSQFPGSRSSTNAAGLRKSFVDHVEYTRGKNFDSAGAFDRYTAIALTVRDRLAKTWVDTQRRYAKHDVKYAYYLSAEYLLGRALGNNLISAGLWDQAREALRDAGLDLTSMLEMEPDAGLGNGGLGRLAACFLDSLASLDMPGMGYGIRYEFGIFTQEIINGYQVERADEWLKFGNPWEIVRPDRMVPVRFFGHVEQHHDTDGTPVSRWVGGRTVVGVPWDTPIAGFGGRTVNTLRLWQARASAEFDFALFNDGDYERSVVEKNETEVISKVLYPNDQNQAGKELRLKQEYFFVACSIADIMRRYLKTHTDFVSFPKKVAMQLNDTHPAIAVAELMRVLIDEKRVPWDEAWAITQATIGYTNHTLLPEALERWPVSLFERLLPRHLQIIFEVNQRHLRQVQIRWPMDEKKLASLSLIGEGREKEVRMAALAVVGSHSVNGVAALHSKLLKETVLSDFAEMFPERFNNKTNGVTPRRWLLSCNPRLAKLLNDTIGTGWAANLDELVKLEKHVDDAAFVAAFREAKLANKAEFSSFLRDLMWVNVDPSAIMDVQIKRLHEYKRQLLNALHIVHLWLQARKDPTSIIHPRTFVFGAKAAPGYRTAKLIIRLINGIGEVVNNESAKTGIKVCFVPNYRVSLAERIIPAADVSEQISTAGMEASGTGNMKFAMNGALTIGTLDGANIEIREKVGPENFFLFGKTAEEVDQAKADGYSGRDVMLANPALKEVLELIASGFFSPEDRDLFKPLVQSLLDDDRYLVLADFDPYVQAQREVAKTYTDPKRWWRSSILNVARTGFFSSDRTIREYAKDIWGISPAPIP